MVCFLYQEIKFSYSTKCWIKHGNFNENLCKLVFFFRLRKYVKRMCLLRLPMAMNEKITCGKIPTWSIVLNSRNVNNVSLEPNFEFQAHRSNESFRVSCSQAHFKFRNWFNIFILFLGWITRRKASACIHLHDIFIFCLLTNKADYKMELLLIEELCVITTQHQRQKLY